MAKKIILFLSLLSEDESKRKTKDYACATGVLGMDEAHKITGTQRVNFFVIVTIQNGP